MGVREDRQVVVGVEMEIKGKWKVVYERSVI